MDRSRTKSSSSAAAAVFRDMGLRDMGLRFRV